MCSGGLRQVALKCIRVRALNLWLEVDIQPYVHV